MVNNASWSFSGKVPITFEDHILKSVPLYPQGHQLILELSDFFLTNHSICYDIGCSTGLLLESLANRHSSIKSEFVGLDIEVDMIEYANNKHKKASNVNFIHSNVVEFDFEKADLIVSYYTLQFVRPKVRQLIINKIYNTLNWGGAFICFEKVRGPDARFQDISNQLYTEFKLNNGYSPENIITKSKSLKGVLEPFSTQGNLDLFRRAGFSDITTIMKYICFEGFLMIK